MPRQRSPTRDLAYQLWLDSGGQIKLKDIAAKVEVSESQIRKWKSQDIWNGNVTNQAKGNVTKRKGGQPGNKNAKGSSGGAAPRLNKNAEKHGLFSKYLPDETLDIMEALEGKSPLDILWDQIKIQYTAIIRAQKIMYVENQQDKTIERVAEQSGKVMGEKWEVQQAWDKHGNFLQAQSRAMTALNGMIKNYEELLHRNWDLATEEQRNRIDLLKAQRDKITGDNTEIEDLDEVEADVYGGDKKENDPV